VNSGTVYKSEKISKKIKRNSIEIVYCDLRFNQHILKGFNFPSKIYFSDNKVSRTFSKGIILKNCPKVVISNNKFIYNYHPKIYKNLKEISWLCKYITHNPWKIKHYADESNYRDKIIYNPFLVLICVENSNLNLIDNYFAENNGRLILVQQNLESKFSYSSNFSFLKSNENSKKVTQNDSKDQIRNSFDYEKKSSSRFRSHSVSTNKDMILYSFHENSIHLKNKNLL